MDVIGDTPQRVVFNVGLPTGGGIFYAVSGNDMTIPWSIAELVDRPVDVCLIHTRLGREAADFRRLLLPLGFVDFSESSLQQPSILVRERFNYFEDVVDCRLAHGITVFRTSILAEDDLRVMRSLVLGEIG